MNRPRSLRGRLGLAAAIGAGLLTSVAVVAVTVLAWQSSADTIVDDVTLAAFVASEADGPASGPLPKNGQKGFVVSLDEVGEVIAQTESLPAQLLSTLVDDVWALTTEDDEVVSVTYEATADVEELTVAGVRCVDAATCDTVIVGAYRESLLSYLASRLLLLMLPVLLVAALAWSAARWLVGRSLRPVEQMRRELTDITETSLDGRVEVPATGDELEELGETFNLTIERLQAVVGANERFVADAAHELRSPIAGARAAVELEGGKNPGGILDDALVELDRATRLMDDLLVLARRGTTPPDKLIDIDLDDLTRAELRRTRDRFPSTELTSMIEPVRVRGHVDDLRRVLSNLIENACLYGASKVHVVVAVSAGIARVEVHDDGPGIPNADTARIFERFTRLDESRSRATGGSGLGLAIAGEIADDHGATIAVQPSTLGGACFVLRVPPQRVSRNVPTAG